MPLQRHQHWATRSFHEFLRGRRAAPFAWGTNDCALFAADAIQAFTGVDIAAEFRGVDGKPAYTDEASAMALIAKVTGGSTIEDAAAWCAEKHGLVEWSNPLFAQRGDLVLVENAGRLISGVVHLCGHVAAMAESGHVRLNISAVRRSWHV